MECLDCYKITFKVFWCACAGIPVCAECLVTHLGDSHYIYDKTTGNLDVLLYSRLKPVEDIKSFIKSYIEEKIEQNIKTRSKYDLTRTNSISEYKLSIDLGLIKSFLDENFKISFKDYCNLSEYMPIYLKNYIKMIHIPTFTHSVVPIEREYRQFCTIEYFNNSIYLIGGIKGLGQGTKDIFCKSLTAAPLNKKIKLKYERYYHASVIYKSWLLVIGGYGHKGSKNTIEVHSLQENTRLKTVILDIDLVLPNACIFEECLIVSYVTTDGQFKIRIDIGLLVSSPCTEIKALRPEQVNYGSYLAVVGNCLVECVLDPGVYTWSDSSPKIHDNTLFYFRHKDRKLFCYHRSSQSLSIKNI
jgi:hypothetical protein